MNWILIITGAIFLICVVMGIYRGAIKIAVSLVATILTLVLVFFLTPYASKAICSLTPLDDVLESQVIQTITKAVTSGGTQDDGQSRLTEENVRRVMEAAGVSEDDLAAAGISIQSIINGEVTGEQLEQFGVSSRLFDGLQAGSSSLQNEILETEIPRDMQISAIEKTDLPEVFKNLLLTNNNSEIYQKLGVDTFIQYVARYLARLVINIIAFLLTFLIVTIIFRAVIFALDFVADLPILGWINRLAGGVVGAGCALFIIWFGFVLITLLYPTEIGKELASMVNENKMLSFLYEHNYVMQLATRIK